MTTQDEEGDGQAGGYASHLICWRSMPSARRNRMTTDHCGDDRAEREERAEAQNVDEDVVDAVRVLNLCSRPVRRPRERERCDPDAADPSDDSPSAGEQPSVGEVEGHEHEWDEHSRDPCPAREPGCELGDGLRAAVAAVVASSYASAGRRERDEQREPAEDPSDRVPRLARGDERSDDRPRDGDRPPREVVEHGSPRSRPRRGPRSDRSGQPEGDASATSTCADQRGSPRPSGAGDGTALLVLPSWDCETQRRAFQGRRGGRPSEEHDSPGAPNANR